MWPPTNKNWKRKVGLPFRALSLRLIPPNDFGSTPNHVCVLDEPHPMVGSIRKPGSKGGDLAAEDGLKYYRIYVRDSLGTHPIPPRFMGIILGNQGEPDPQEGDQLGELDRVKPPFSLTLLVIMKRKPS